MADILSKPSKAAGLKNNIFKLARLLQLILVDKGKGWGRSSIDMEVMMGIFLGVASLAVGIGAGAGALQLTFRFLRIFKDR